MTGGTFNRDNDAQYPATISNFKLDVYEVTVARFRKFVDGGNGTQAAPPANGAGAHPKIADSGWQASFNASLEADTAALKAALKCSTGYPAWSDAPGANENKPINCVTWYEAFAFCAWDGGRLPTEAEWNYAAAGGNEQRTYPWGNQFDGSKLVYNCDGAGDQQCLDGPFSNLKDVGSKSPAGDGKFGQADLAGNLWEYVLDFERYPYSITNCNDCADIQPGVPNRMFRGGAFFNDENYQTTSTRIGDVPTQRDHDVGIRCARSP